MTNYILLLDLLRKNGMDYKWSNMFVKKLIDDENAFTVDSDTKRWALERGFFPGRVELYGLNDKNYENYLPDYNYFMIHPINNHFKIWVNDKLTLKYVLNNSQYADTMPEYYLYVENNGNYTYLMDAPHTDENSENYIFNLLKEKGILAIKPNSGTSGGKGFVKLENKDDEIFINNKPIKAQLEFDKIISELNNHIITEYVHQNDEFAQIWASSECTLRVIMVKLPKESPYLLDQWECIVAYARFGSIISGGASNLSSGGIGIGFDFQTGVYKDEGIRYKKFCPDGLWKLNKHPDTDFFWKGSSLPNWEYVKDKIFALCNYITSLDYLGFDIIITANGMKLCEINTHPAADYEQVMCSPLLTNENTRDFFKSKGLFKIDNTSFYELYKESQT